MIDLMFGWFVMIGPVRQGNNLLHFHFSFFFFSVVSGANSSEHHVRSGQDS